MCAPAPTPSFSSHENEALAKPAPARRRKTSEHCTAWWPHSVDYATLSALRALRDRRAAGHAGERGKNVFAPIAALGYVMRKSIEYGSG